MPHQCTDCGHVFPDGSKAMLSGCPDCEGNTFQFLPERASDPDSDAAVGPEASETDAAEPVPENPSDPSPVDSPPDPPERSSASTVGRAAAVVRDWVHDTSSVPSEPEPADAVEGDEVPPSDATATDESGDRAVASEIETGSDGDSPPRSTAAGPPADGISAESATPHASDPSAGGARSEDTVEPTEREIEDRAQTDARTDAVSANDLPASPPSDPEISPPDASNGRIESAPVEERPDLEDLRQELNDQFESIRIVAPGQYELNLMELYDREEYIIALRENGRYVIEAPETWLARDDRD